MKFLTKIILIGSGATIISKNIKKRMKKKRKRRQKQLKKSYNDSLKLAQTYDLYEDVKGAKNIYTVLVGGLGNQLFMIFNLIALSKKYNFNLKVCYDKNYEKHHPSQKYSLFKNINFNKLSKSELKDYEFYNEPSFKYNEIILDNEKNNFIEGYFQSYKYFINYQDEIKKYIYIDNDKINKIKKLFSSYGKKILSLHVRLGDYIKSRDFHYISPFEYYKNALSKYNLDEYQIILFSDDSKLADKILKPLKINYIIADNFLADDEDQIFMLSLSNVKICSASTYSLMSCYLNEIFKFVDNCEYVFPDKWFGARGPDYNMYDLLILNHKIFKSENNYIIQNIEGINNDITLVSGYWILNKSKFSNNEYCRWLHNTLCVLSPLIFFSNSLQIINLVKKIRKGLPTYYVLLDLDNFLTKKYKDLFIIDKIHCPSKELNMIWNEKVFLIKKAFELNPFNSNFYMWYDAGFCLFRDTPVPQITLDSSFLHKDKVSFTNPNHVKKFEKSKLSRYGYHYITGTYIIPKNIILKIAKIYKSYLDKNVNIRKLWTDQVIWTHIYNGYPDLFLNAGEGYGSIILKVLGCY